MMASEEEFGKYIKDYIYIYLNLIVLKYTKL